MPSFPATPSKARPAKPRRIVFVAFDGALATDIAGPSDAFGIANRLNGDAPSHYDIRYVSVAGGVQRASSGLTVDTERASALRGEIDTLMISGGSWIMTTLQDRALVRWIASAAKKARRVCSVCSGAFLLAEAGLLDGRRTVTHWALSDEFRARYPRVNLELDPIYARDGNVWTSAGITAGIDLALALIADDLGTAVSMAVAKQMVVFMQRPGGQAQFSAALLGQAAAQKRSDPLLGITTYIAEHIGKDLSVEALANVAGMSPRSFARLFSTRADKLTPAKLVESVRVEAAARALSETGDPVKRIAATCGFGDEERMRRAFLRTLGVAPSEYRARFADSSGSAAR